MRNIVFYMAIIAISIVTSCRNNSILRGVRVDLMSPDKISVLEEDSLFDCRFDEILDCQNIQIVSDTILIVQDYTSEDNIFHFKAYSTLSLDYLGEFISNGRGPEEMIRPHVIKSNSSDNLLCLSDNSTSTCGFFDIKSSDDIRKDLVLNRINVPDNVLDWIPATDSSLFSMSLNSDKLHFLLSDMCGNEITTYQLYNDANGQVVVPKISCLFTNNTQSGKVAAAMLSLPQIYILNTSDGKVKSVAVNSQYRNWKNIVTEMFGPETIEYYSGIASDDDYIYAVYSGASIMEVNSGEFVPSLHVLDWDGNFLYELRLEDSISNLAVDSHSKMLYCLRKSDHSILRYDLSRLE